MAKDANIPAWMAAQALVIKAKNVLTEEAIDTLYKEIEAKRMTISGSFMPMELEKSGEMEQGLFLIRHLMDEKDEMMKSFSKFIRDTETNPQKLDATAVRQIEEAKKFMLAVTKIDTLTQYGMIFDSWFNDASMQIGLKDAAEVLAKTMGGPNSHRMEALKYLVRSKLFKEEGLFSKEERDTLSRALELSQK